MSEVLRVAELVGIDIVITGMLVIITVVFARHVFNAQDQGLGLRKASRLIRNYRYSGVPFVKMICVVGLASMLGRVFTLLGDELLDSPLVEAKLFFFMPSFDDLFVGRGASDAVLEYQVKRHYKVLDAPSASTDPIFTPVGAAEPGGLPQPSAPPRATDHPKKSENDCREDVKGKGGWLAAYARQFWQPWCSEDQIKVETLEDAANWAQYSMVAVRGIVERHRTGSAGACGGKELKPVENPEPLANPEPEVRKTAKKYCEEREIGYFEDLAKGFFQHANAVVRARGSDATREALQRENSIAELLTVVFVGIWILLIATLGPIFRALKLLASRKRDDFGRRERALLLRNGVALLVGLWLLEGFALRLWTEQVKLFDRRLISSYLTIASQGDPAMGIPMTDADDALPQPQLVATE